MVPDLLRRLYAHMAWADEQLLLRLDEGYGSDGRLVRMLAHLFAAEHVWLRRIQGAVPELAVWPDLAAHELQPLARANAREFGEILASTTAEDLSRDVVYRTSGGERFETPLADILLHVAMHGSYHRGQAALLARAAGVEPVNTDFITYSRAHAVRSQG